MFTNGESYDEIRNSIKISTLLMSLTFGIPAGADNKPMEINQYIDCIMDQLKIPKPNTLVIYTGTSLIEDIPFEEVLTTPSISQNNANSAILPL